MKLAVPDLISNSHIPAVAAVELGFFEQRGLEMELQLVAPVERAYQALRDGRLDVVAGSANSMLSAFPDWKGAKVICAQSQRTYWFLVMRKDLGLARGELTSLKGMRIGAAPWIGLAFKYLLGEAGIDLERDETVIESNFGSIGPDVNFGVAAADALASGEIDGFWANGMGAELAVRRGIGTIVLDVRRDEGPSSAAHCTFASIVITDEFASEKPDVAAACVLAIRDAQKAIREDPEILVPIARKHFPPEEAALIGELVRRDLPFYDAFISAEAIAGMVRFARKMGLCRTEASYSDIVAERFAPLWS
jgi:NitT/TauT family transport system substrate-binding protein